MVDPFERCRMKTMTHPFVRRIQEATRGEFSVGDGEGVIEVGPALDGPCDAVAFLPGRTVVTADVDEAWAAEQLARQRDRPPEDPSTGLGLFVAGVLRAEATLAAANLVYLLLMAGGAVVIPSSSYGALGRVTLWLPSGALGDAMRQALLYGDSFGGAGLRDLLVLLAWGVVGTVLTARTFKWE